MTAIKANPHVQESERSEEEFEYAQMLASREDWGILGLKSPKRS